MRDDIFQKLQAAGSDEEREWLLLEMVLATLPMALQDAVWAAAVPHWFDAQFLTALLDAEAGPPFQARSGFETLTGLSFVEPFPGRGYNIHERSRALLLNRLWQDDRERYRELSRRAAAYCAQQDQEDATWRMETIYHLLIAEPDEGATQLQKTGWEWQNPPNFAFDQVEALAQIAREHADGHRLTKRGQGWTLFWEAHLDWTYDRNQSAKRRLLQIKITEEEDRDLAVSCIESLGNAHLQLYEYDQARQRYEQALSLYEATGARLGQANCFQALGNVHLKLDEYDQARQRYEQALSLYEAIGTRLGQANCFQALGDVHLKLDEYDQARQRYEQALPLFEAIGDRLGQANCIKALGNVHLQLDEVDQTRQRYEQALPLYEAIGDRLGQANCIRALGDVHRRLYEYNQARQRYEQALSLYEAIGALLSQANTILDLGYVHRDQEEYEAARQRFEAARQIYQLIGAQLGENNVVLALGDLDRYAENWAQAEERYQEALHYYEQTGMVFNMALAYRRLGLTAEGTGDINAARRYYEQALALYIQIDSPLAKDVQANLDNLPDSE